ncbi:hypothetical protein CXF36_10465, partial [Corynebacterium bovis]
PGAGTGAVAAGGARRRAATADVTAAAGPARSSPPVAPGHRCGRTVAAADTASMWFRGVYVQ